MAHDCEDVGVGGDVGDWLPRGLGLGLKDWEETEGEEGGLAEMQGWLGGGFDGLGGGGAGACFLVPGMEMEIQIVTRQTNNIHLRKHLNPLDCC